MATNVTNRQASEFTDLGTIDRHIEQLEADLEALRRARIVLARFGQNVPVGKAAKPSQSPARKQTRKNQSLTVAEASHRVLKLHPQLHVRELLKRLQGEYKIKTTEKNLINTLSRWATKKKLFKRVGPNVFARVENAPAQKK
jgi:hypothetical protein